MSPPNAQDGNTLIEVVVAFAILTLSLGALSQSFSMGLARSTRARNLEHAVLLASSIRERLGADIPLNQASQGSRVGDCSWTVESREVHRPLIDPDSNPHAFKVKISAICGEGDISREARLDTFELAALP